ncbi:Retrovirus-related Pol polyprotein from transposon TNT 1-94 [Bienertia sinuspersici]
MEIILASKRKLGFVTGAVKKDTLDSEKADQFDTCNSMVIAWILANVSENIKRSILFVDSAREIWKQLESRFSKTSGSRKYQLNKEVFKMKQQGRSVSDYYTAMKALWEEIDGLTMLPAIKVMTKEVNAFVKALSQHQEEQRLFQILNGLDEGYSALRSHILMFSPLPSVEGACGILQQEENQWNILKTDKDEE